MCYFNFQCTERNVNITYSEDIPPNTVHMAWQIPQYFILTCAEVVFSVTGLEFSYSQVGFTLQSSQCVKSPDTKKICDLFLSGGSTLQCCLNNYVLQSSRLVQVGLVSAAFIVFHELYHLKTWPPVIKSPSYVWLSTENKWNYTAAVKQESPQI